MQQLLTERGTGNPPRRARILVASDNALIRHGLRIMLNASTAHEVLADASPVAHLLHALDHHRPDVAIVDLSTCMCDVEVVRRAVAFAPAESRLVLLCHSDEPAQWTVPAAAILPTTASPTSLLDALQQLLAGDATEVQVEVPAPARVERGAPVAQDLQVTPRERQVIELIAQGLCNKRIARELSISVTTVRTHRQRLMAKLGLHNSVEIAQFGARMFGTGFAAASGAAHAAA